MFPKLRAVFWKSFRIKEYLNKEINDYYIENIEGKVTLGVQIRLTDMARYYNVSKLDTYTLIVNKIIMKHPKIEQVFPATDDEEIIDEFCLRTNRQVVYLKGIYRATSEKRDSVPVERLNYTRPHHNYLLGKEVIMDIFILSRCKYILKADI